MKRIFRFNNCINLWNKKNRRSSIGWDLSNSGCSGFVFVWFNVFVFPTYITIELLNFRFNFDLVEV
jgi:hypothetical protein